MTTAVRRCSIASCLVQPCLAIRDVIQASISSEVARFAIWVPLSPQTLVCPEASVLEKQRVLPAGVPKRVEARREADPMTDCPKGPKSAVS